MRHAKCWLEMLYSGSVNSVAGFMFLKSSTKGREAVVGVWLAITRGEEKHFLIQLLNAGPLGDEIGSSYLLISLLRILSNMNSNSSDQAKDQDLLSHLLKSLASLAGTTDGKNITALLQASGLPNTGFSIKIAQQVPDTVSNHEPSRPSVSNSSMDDCVIIEQPPKPLGKFPKITASDRSQILSGRQGGKPLPSRESAITKAVTPEYGRIQLLEIDLNSPYNESHDDLENLGSCRAAVNPGIHHDSRKSSPQTSGNYDSTFTQSPSSSSGDSQWQSEDLVLLTP